MLQSNKKDYTVITKGFISNIKWKMYKNSSRYKKRQLTNQIINMKSMNKVHK